MLKNFRIKRPVGLILIGYLLVLSFSGCTKKNDFLLPQYRERNLVRDSKGNQYKVVYKSKFPHSYGCDIFIYRSADGQNWKRVGMVPVSGYEVYEAWGYSLTSGDKNDLALVYVGTGKGKKAIYFTKSTDNGNTWTKPIPINDDVRAERSYPEIIMEGRNIFVAWLEESESRFPGIYFCSSDDGGENWSKDIYIRKGEDIFFKIGPDGRIWLTYVGGERKNIIYLSYSLDNGKRWHTETTGELPLMVKEPYLTFKGKCLYLIFQGASPTSLLLSSRLNYRIYYLKSPDEGKTWSEIIKIKEKGEK